MEQRHAMDVRATVIVLVLCFLWGGNQVAIKLSNAGAAPIFAAALRSVVASTLVAAWCLLRGRAMLPRGRGWLDGAAIGMMFGTEFALLYIGLIFTTASHGVLMLFTAPFFVAIGAHWLLPKEPLSWRKVAGLVLAFAGVASTLADNLTAPTPQQIVGDLLILVAGLLWGITSLYLKAVVRDRMTFAQTLFCQLAFSALLLGAVHWAVEARAIWLARPVIFAALFYQSVVVAFASYLVWFWLIQVYPVSLVSAYTFFGPIFGVLLGALAFREPLTAALLLGAAMVSGGMLLINWPASARPAASLSPA